MNILFVHQNFPGQFPHLAPALAGRGHRVLALTDEHNARPAPSGVQVLRYRAPAEPDRAATGPAHNYARAAARGVHAARAAVSLRDRHGFVPDVVLGHPGWGETLFLRDVWPQARHLAYAEFYYAATGLDAGFDPEFQPDTPERRFGVTARKAHLAQAMLDADAGLAPTRWQAGTFPPELRGKIAVIHDGIDCDRIAPDPGARVTLTPEGAAPVTLGAGDEVLSFVSRNLEPYRGVHVFLRALPAVLAARPRARVVVVGGDGVSYGGAPADGRSWKRLLLDELGDRIDPARVLFVGRIPYADFVALMQVTRVHAYLSYPFVLSWSMLEAMAAGAHVVGSDTPPVREVLDPGKTGDTVGFFDIAGWSGMLTAALAEPARFDNRRAGARALMRERYDLRGVCLPRLLGFVESGGRDTGPAAARP